MARSNSVRNGILIAICVQNAASTLLRRYSAQTETVSSKELLLTSEIVKLTICIVLIFQSSEPSEHKFSTGYGRLIFLLQNCKAMWVLAAIYAAMNLLSFVSLNFISAGEFTIMAQLKILTTAYCSHLFIGTYISSAKWRALLLIVIGCVLVMSPGFVFETTPGNPVVAEQAPADKKKAADIIFWGYGAVGLEVVLSGCSSIYFEKIVKSTSSDVSIWERNFQLSSISIFIFGCTSLYDRSTLAAAPVKIEPHLFIFSLLSWSVIVSMSIGGLLVAATLKYADSIMKTLATSASIVISTLMGFLLLSGPMNLSVICGAVITIIAIFNYTFDE